MIALSATPIIVSNAQHTTIYCRIKPAPAAAYTPNIANNAPKIFALNAMISSTSKETIVITVLLWCQPVFLVKVLINAQNASLMSTILTDNPAINVLNLTKTAKLVPHLTSVPHAWSIPPILMEENALIAKILTFIACIVRSKINVCNVLLMISLLVLKMENAPFAKRLYKDV